MARTRYRYSTCDVFTETRFGGNPLAVLPDAEGLTPGQMQQIACELNLAETAFVFPARQGGDRCVRIFTPRAEVPFAGHPNIGTAFVLASTGELGAIQGTLGAVFEERAGRVPITIRREPGKPIWCELAAPQTLTVGKEVSPTLLASAVSLRAEDTSRPRTHPRWLLSACPSQSPRSAIGVLCSAPVPTHTASTG